MSYSVGEGQETKNWINLAGLTASRGCSREAGGPDRVEDELFSSNIGSLGVYNVLIGYLLRRERRATTIPLRLGEIAPNSRHGLSPGVLTLRIADRLSGYPQLRRASIR